jgi:catechol 2,3-dioxygenase-like lactoylglutathione lyase family enzyme
MDHLALAVRGQERSRRFYELYLGFEAEVERRSEVSWEPESAAGER